MSVLSDLFFANNWRRMLILTKTSTKDPDVGVFYINLNKDVIPSKDIIDFLNKYSYEYGFDFDTQSKLIWSNDDNVSIYDLQDRIEKNFPGSTNIVKIPPSEAHGLNFDEFDLCD